MVGKKGLGNQIEPAMRGIGYTLVSIAERALTALAMVLMFFSMLLIAFLIHSTSGNPVLIADKTNGHALRFRTTGHGSAAFQTIGRFLRTYSIDRFPAFWSVLRGDIRLMDIIRD